MALMKTTKDKHTQADSVMVRQDSIKLRVGVGMGTIVSDQAVVKST